MVTDDGTAQSMKMSLRDGREACWPTLNIFRGRTQSQYRLHLVVSRVSFLETVLAVVPVSICWWASKVKSFLILMTNGFVEIWATVFRCTTQGKWHFKPIKRSAAQLWEYPSVFSCHVKTTTCSFMHSLALTHLHTPTWHMILMWETRFPPILPISSVWTDRTKSPGLDSDSLTRKVPGSSFAVRSFSAFGPDRWPWYHLRQKIKHWRLMMQPLWHKTCRMTGN